MTVTQDGPLRRPGSSTKAEHVSARVLVLARTAERRHLSGAGRTTVLHSIEKLGFTANDERDNGVSTSLSTEPTGAEGP